MASIALGKKKSVNTLKVEIGDKSYNVPLAGSLSVAEIKALRNGDDDGFSFFEKYIPQEVISELTLDDFKALNNAWKKESEKVSGVDLGE